MDHVTHRKRIVTGNEENVENGGGGEVAGQQAAGVGQHRLGVHQSQNKERNCPNTMEDLQLIKY